MVRVSWGTLRAGSLVVPRGWADLLSPTHISLSCVHGKTTQSSPPSRTAVSAHRRRPKHSPNHFRYRVAAHGDRFVQSHYQTAARYRRPSGRGAGDEKGQTEAPIRGTGDRIRVQTALARAGSVSQPCAS